MAVGGRVNVYKKLDLIADLFWAISTEEQDKEEIPLELLTGVRYGLPHNLVANLGMGFGLTQGIGTPVVRVIGGLAYQHAFEREQRMSDPPVKTCPKCKGRKVTKLISQTSFVLKGGGWYADGYASKKS